MLRCAVTHNPSKTSKYNFFFFQVLFTTTRFSSVLSCEDLLNFISPPQCKYMYFHISKKSSFTWMFIWTQFIDQLPVGLLAQLVERCTGIAEVMGSNPIRAKKKNKKKTIFFRSYLQRLVSVVFLAARIC